ncbi:related to Prenylcysteine oxidase precursor [Sporisorium reilianum f. sp. reilianum]|uniref:Related to Prenylcysteine oxidase n=1 Tax=Sporisorium reilianum f. sp. reilianum TaxID=72559 RepID=A0A2N8UJV8_9BASI|nr:related to Prenylcysteine oxidase precursor [Sporisorium reilianum f. sp. reilianum]
MVRCTVLYQLGLVLAALHQVPFTAAQLDARDNDAFYSSSTRKASYIETEPAAAHSNNRTLKVAIIGGGPTGTSAAYFLSRASAQLAQLNTTQISTTLYERSAQLGGRTAVTYPYDNSTYDPVELGASIFADVNLNLRRAVKEFALETGAHTGLAGQMGIWDGQQFLFEGDQSSWWTSAKFFLRYGYSAITTEGIVKRQLGYFAGLYSPRFLHARRGKSGETASGYPWSSVEDLAAAINATELVATTGMQFFKDRRVSELFIEEMVEAATRVNYAQDTDQIHGFGALVSLAASGATGVKQGNVRIFDEFARRSGARIRTGVEGHVTGIVRYTTPATQTQWYIGTRSGEGELYDAVIVATPWHNADITLLNTPQRVKAKPYVHLHVTLLTTSAPSPRPEYFGLGEQDAVPTTVLTSSESVRRASSKTPSTPEAPPHSASAQPAAKTPTLDFFSLNYLRTTTPPSGTNKEYIVKIFSPHPVSDALLARLFGSNTVSWIHRHTWDSYPYLTPTTRFPRIEVDASLFYPNAMESLVSTMETSTLAAKNAVGLLLQRWFGDEFVNGRECDWTGRERDPLENKNWAGWGCDSG